MYRFARGGLDSSGPHSDSVAVQLGILVGHYVGANYQTAFGELIRDATVQEGGEGAPGAHTAAGGDLHDHVVWTH